MERNVGCDFRTGFPFHAFNINSGNISFQNVH